MRAAHDEDEAVRAEAMLGLAHRDRELALPLVKRALAATSVMPSLLEAAALIAHLSLVEDLREFAQPSGDDFLDQLAIRALTACENETPLD